MSKIFLISISVLATSLIAGVGLKLYFRSRLRDIDGCNGIGKENQLSNEKKNWFS